MVRALASVKETLSAYGFAHPKFLFTDKPNEDIAFFSQHLPSLKKMETQLNSTIPTVAMHVENTSGNIPICSVEATDYHLVKSMQEIDRAIALLRKELNSRPIEDRVLGFDEEYEYGLKTKFPPHGRDKVGLLQIAYKNEFGSIKALLLHVWQLPRLPDSLLDLFRDSMITFVGKRVLGDIRIVGDDFGIRDVTDTVKCMDIARLAKDRDLVHDARIGLKALVELLLQERMSKDDSVRSSKWGNSNLTVEQLEYAALDATKSLECYLKLISFPDYAHRLETDNATAGTKVDVIPSHGTTGDAEKTPIAAIGTFVNDPIWQEPVVLKPRLSGQAKKQLHCRSQESSWTISENSWFYHWRWKGSHDLPFPRYCP